MGTGGMCLVRHGRARQISGMRPYGDCRRVLLVPGPLGQYYRETRCTRLEGRHVANRSSDPRVAYTEVKVQVRDQVHVVGIVASFAPRESVFGENSFYRAPGGKWAQETCAGYPQRRYATGEPGKV